MQKVIWTAIKATAAALALLALFRTKGASDDMTREEAADILDRFLEGKGDGWEFSNFVDEYSGDDELIIRVSTEVCHINRDYPPSTGERRYCNEEGMRRIRELEQLLRRESQNKAAI